MDLTPLEAVQRYYGAVIPGRRAELMELLDPHVEIDVPAGFPGSGGTYHDLRGYVADFLYGFYGSFDLRVEPEEFLDAGERVVALGRFRGTALATGAPVDVPFAHIWTVHKGLLVKGLLFTDTEVLSRAAGGPGPSGKG
jgi:uncharacterized protein